MAEPDRRVRRTRRILHEALIALVLERGYERTTVQDILDRADVGRSTFYAHYRDKEALLMASFDGLREQLSAELAGPDAAPAGPVTALFQHAYRNRRVYQALCGGQGGNLVFRHLHDLLSEQLQPHLGEVGPDLPVDAVAEFYTSAALGLLTWWVGQGFRLDPGRLAQVYEQLAAPRAAARPAGSIIGGGPAARSDR